MGIGITGISSCLRTAIPRFVRIFVPDDAVEFAAEALRVPPVPLLALSGQRGRSDEFALQGRKSPGLPVLENHGTSWVEE